MDKSRNTSLPDLKDVVVENATPFVDKDGAKKFYFSAFILPKIDRSILLAVTVILGALAIIEGFAINKMAGPPDRVPYFLDVERDAAGQPTGRVELSEHVAKAFEVNDANKRYFLNLWLSWVMSIDPKFSVKDWEPRAITWARGKAIPQVTDWINVKEKIAARLATEPGLTRDYDSATISFTDDKTAIAHVTLIERLNGIERARLRKVVIIEHTLVPLKKEAEEYTNPIGLVVAGFVVNDDLEKQ